MSIEVFKKVEQILQLRAKVLQGERERLNEAKTISISEARKQLRERVNSM